VGSGALLTGPRGVGKRTGDGCSVTGVIPGDCCPPNVGKGKKPPIPLFPFAILFSYRNDP
jgi:hypothetical protein